MELTVQPGLYRHFKGNLYEVLMIAKHSETQEELVIYRDVTDPAKCWARPLSMWNETVERDGKRFTRFTRVESANASCQETENMIH